MINAITGNAWAQNKALKRLSLLALIAFTVGCSGTDETASSLSVSSLSSSNSSISSSASVSSSAPQASSSSPASGAQNKTGEELYKEHSCNGCHDDDGQNEVAPIIFANWNIDNLTSKIHNTMPQIVGSPSDCEDECARLVAEYILSLAPQISCDVPVEPLPRRLRLLTNREYANTINDLLQRTDGATIIQSFEADTLIEGFDNNADGSVATTGRVDGYWSAAEKIASTQTNVEALLECGQTPQNASPDDIQRCADRFVPNFGERVFRRPLSNDEVTRYKAVFNLGETRQDAFAFTLQALLSSPHFLYRSEVGTESNGDYSLTQYEIASLLSYTFWGSTPDKDLLDAARNNQLNNTDNLRQQAQRLLQDNRAKLQFNHFGRQWFRLNGLTAKQKDEGLFPDYSAQLSQWMDQELDLFLQDILLDSNATTGDIYTADFTYLNQGLAEHYGIDGVTTSDFQKVTASAERSGLLTKGTLLTLNSTSKENDPIHRGLLIRRNALCQTFGTPPGNVGEIEPLDPNKPLRERLLAHSNNDSCSACHQHIDPLGFAFEQYDAIGRYRTTEGNNLPVDSKGALIGMRSMADVDEHPFEGLNDLSQALANAGADQINTCATEQFIRYQQGVAKPHQCTVEATLTRWQDRSNNLIDLWLAPLADPQFSIRR